MADNLVVRNREHLTNAHVIEKVADGVRDASRRIGKDKLAEAADCTPRAVEKWIAEGSCPDLVYLLRMARTAPEVLTPVLADEGWAGLTPSTTAVVDGMALVTGISTAVAEYLKRLADGRRCHIDEAVLAAMFRPLIPQMQAIVSADDARRLS